MLTPELSIVVCTYNRQKFIYNCLQCLSLQTLDAGSFEVILVDNNSTDKSAEIIKQFIAAHPQLPFRYVFESNKGLSFARNRGIAEAKAGIITFIDDDAEATPVFAKTVLSFMQAHPEASGAGGRILPKYSEKGEPEWMSKYLIGYVGKTDHGEPVRMFEGAMKYPVGCNMTYRKEILLKAGGFNNKLTFRSDDKQIYYAVKPLNDKIYFLPQALVYHNIDAERLEFKSFKKLFLKTGSDERIRVAAEKGDMAVVRKMIEFITKFAASLLIWFLYFLKRQEIKGRYIVYSQWFTLKGFFAKNVFVR
jgi:glycosyltransferase involved in cell wall biosynthesis